MIAEYHKQTARDLWRALDRTQCHERGVREVPLEALCSAVNYLFAQERLAEDGARLDWLDAQLRAGRVRLLINNEPRGEGIGVRGAIDDAIQRTA